MLILEDGLHVKQSFIQLSGSNTPDAAPTRAARIWYDRSAAVLKFSVNGGAFGANPGSLALADLTAMVRTNAPAASGAAAVLRLDSGTFAGSAAGTMLGINLHTGTSDLIKVQKAGADRLTLSETGILTAVKGVFGGATVLGTLSAFAADGDTIAFVARAGAVSPAANWWELQNSSGTAVLTFGGSSPFFHVTAQANGFFYNGQISGSHRMGATADTPSAIPICARGIAGQTADLFQARASTDAVLFSLAAAGHPTLGEAVNLIVGTATGTKIGTAATQKLGFFNATPIVQPAAYTQTFATADRTHAARTATTLTDNTTGTANTTLEALTSGTVYATDVAAIRNNFADLAAAINALIIDLADTAQLANSLVDDQQALGLAA